MRAGGPRCSAVCYTSKLTRREPGRGGRCLRACCQGVGLPSSRNRRGRPDRGRCVGGLALPRTSSGPRLDGAGPGVSGSTRIGRAGGRPLPGSPLAKPLMLAAAFMSRSGLRQLHRRGSPGAHGAANAVLSCLVPRQSPPSSQACARLDGRPSTRRGERIRSRTVSGPGQRGHPAVDLSRDPHLRVKWSRREP